MTRIAQVLLVFCSTLLIYSPALAQKRKGAKSTATVKKSVSKSGIIEMQAGLVYPNGVQPVARTKFVILDNSLEKILQDAGLQKPERAENFAHAYAMGLRYPSSFGEFAAKAQQVLEPHIKQSLMTDFEGKIMSTPLPIGTYYIMGIGQTRQGYAIWNLKVDVVVGQNKIILDQNNAVYAF